MVLIGHKGYSKELLQDCTGNNHKLYMDVYYNSYDLFRELRSLGVYVLGTMRGRGGEPNGFSQFKKNIKKHVVIAFQKDSNGMLMWYDNPIVTL